MQVFAFRYCLKDLFLYNLIIVLFYKEIYMTFNDLKGYFENTKGLTDFFKACSTTSHSPEDKNALSHAHEKLLSNQISLSSKDVGIGIAYKALKGDSLDYNNTIRYFGSHFINDGNAKTSLIQAQEVMKGFKSDSPTRTLISLLDANAPSELIKPYYNANRGKLNMDAVSSHYQQTKVKSELSAEDKKAKAVEFFLKLDSKELMSNNDLEQSFVERMRATRERIKAQEEQERFVPFARYGYK